MFGMIYRVYDDVEVVRPQNDVKIVMEKVLNPR